MESKSGLLSAQYFRIFAAVCIYWSVSISLVFLNKYLLSSTDLMLDAPLFITWYQCVVTVILCAMLGYASQLFPQYITFPEFKIDKKISREVLPLSVVFVGMITFNNLCLKHVAVAFYYIGRSLTIVFNVIFGFILLRSTTSMRALLCCGVIISGYLLGVNQEEGSGSVSMRGIVYGLLSSMFVALNAIYTKKVLPAVSDNIWRLTLYNNLNALFLFLPLILFNGEVSQLFGFHMLLSLKFWLPMTLSGFFGFMMGYVTGFQIQVTSPLTHNISATAKSAFQTVMAVFWEGSNKDLLWWTSNAVVLLGSGAYTWVKQMEMKKSFNLTSKPAPVLPTVQTEASVNKSPVKVNKSDIDEANDD